MSTVRHEVGMTLGSAYGGHSPMALEQGPGAPGCVRAVVKLRSTGVSLDPSVASVMTQRTRLLKRSGAWISWRMPIGVCERRFGMSRPCFHSR